MIISVLVGALGWGLAWFMYTKRTDIPDRLAEQYKDIYEVLVNKYWVDELYDYVFVRGGKALAHLLWRFDERVVDGAVNGASDVIMQTSDESSRFDLHTIDGSVNGLSVVIKVRRPGVSPAADWIRAELSVGDGAWAFSSSSRPMSSSDAQMKVLSAEQSMMSDAAAHRVPMPSVPQSLSTGLERGAYR